MFLHIGGYEIIPVQEIIAIINRKKITNETFEEYSNRKKNTVAKIIKSVLIMQDNTVYLSHIKSETLKCRIEETRKVVAKGVK